MTQPPTPGAGGSAAGAAIAPDAFDLASLPPAFYADPFPTYRRLREEAPVLVLPSGDVLLTRFSDCERVYRDSAAFSSDKRAEFAPKFGESPLYEHHTTSLVFNDPPLHLRVRKLILGALRPRAIERMEPGLLALVDRLIAQMAEKAAGGATVDLIADFAAAIPVDIIGNLLAIPHADRGPLRGWSLAILGALEPRLTEEQLARGNAAVTAFLAYLEGLVADRRARPGDPETDVLTRLIRGEETGERLSETELLQNCIFILNAGHETTTNLIGNALVLFGEDVAARRQLMEAPDLVESAIEECLRYESPNQLGNRVATRAVEIGGRRFPAGTRVTLCIGAANRDPAVFPDPERFDVARAPNRHLAFGAGIHQCAGLNLARLEGRTAVMRFLDRFPDYSLAGPPVRGGRVRFRGFASIPARLFP